MVTWFVLCKQHSFLFVCSSLRGIRFCGEGGGGSECEVSAGLLWLLRPTLAVGKQRGGFSFGGLEESDC